LIERLDRFRGTIWGLGLGDALGAPFEGGPVERAVWRLIGRTRSGQMRWTDDTQMTIDLIESLLAVGRLDPDDLARRFARSYRWSRGYGPAASRLLKKIARGADWRVANRAFYREGSFGNGAAMRAPAIGLAYGDRPDELEHAARASAEITHAHPLGVAGAVVIARAVGAAVQGRSGQAVFDAALTGGEPAEYRSRMTIAREWLTTGHAASEAEVRAHLGNCVSALESVVTAVYLAVRFLDQPFLALHRFIADCRGDTDTIGAMAGAIWGAVNGAGNLPSEALNRLERRDELAVLAEKLSHAVVA